MAALDKQARELADRRYAEKVRARAEGRAPVAETFAPLPKGNTPEAMNERAKAKLARHATEGKPQSESKPDGEKPAKGSKTPKADESKPDGEKPADETKD
jgi:hypothetical protein